MRKRLGVLFLVAISLAISTAALYLLWAHFFAPDDASAILVTGIIATMVALWGIYSQRAITRRQVTLEHISKLESDGDLIRARLKFGELVKDGNLAQWAPKVETAETQAIFTVLNEFELIAIGIQRGIIDFELYSRWYKSGTIRRWNDAHPFIVEFRKVNDNKMIYHEFEEMVKWFETDKPPSRGLAEGLWF
jgi:hypothetical protein